MVVNEVLHVYKNSDFESHASTTCVLLFYKVTLTLQSASQIIYMESVLYILWVQFRLGYVWLIYFLFLHMKIFSNLILVIIKVIFVESNSMWLNRKPTDFPVFSAEQKRITSKCLLLINVLLLEGVLWIL